MSKIFEYLDLDSANYDLGQLNLAEVCLGDQTGTRKYTGVSQQRALSKWKQ